MVSPRPPVFVATTTPHTMPLLQVPTNTTHTMSPPKIPLELLLKIAHCLTDPDGKLCVADFNSFLQVNYALYVNLNPILWKAAVNSTSSTERVLTQVIRTNDFRNLKIVLEFGADVETLLPEIYRGSGGIHYTNVTPLEVAAAYDEVPMARLLLEHHAKIVHHDQHSHLSHSALHLARSGEMVKLFLDHDANPDEVTVNGYVPLHHYAMRDNVEAMRVILSHGARVTLKRFCLYTPLHEAAQRNIDTVKLLLEHGANAQTGSIYGETPLHLAAKAGRADVAKLLVEHWPLAVKQRDIQGYMPLHYAVLFGRTHVVRLLVESWPEGVRMEGVNGNTPLHFAAATFFSVTEIVRLLVESWPKGKEVLNNDGQIPLMLYEHRSAQPGLSPWWSILDLLRGVH
jgi:ankyrin repeat protein